MMSVILRMLLVWVLLSVPSASAQDTPSLPPSTAEALTQASLPARDRVQLARQLLGVTDIPAPPIVPVKYRLGDVKAFVVSDSSEDVVSTIDARLVGIGEHILVWVDVNYADVRADQMQQLVDAFDTFIYPKVRGLWGSEASPGIDGDTRVFALFAYGLGSGTGAYFSSDNSYPRAVVSSSNEHEMFIYNIEAYNLRRIGLDVLSTTAHEFQHMIRENLNPNPSTWVNEGLSVFTEIYLGYSQPADVIGAYLAMPFTQLTTWADDGPRAPHYGGAGLFFAYLHDRYGLAAMRALSDSDADGVRAVEQALNAVDGGDFDTFFADWVAANIVQRPDAEEGRWGYRLIAPTRALSRPVSGPYPYTRAGMNPPYSADYYALGGLNGQQVSITLTQALTAQVIPTHAPSGQRMWYSHRGDNSVTTLTRAFDLRGAASPELHYRVWYHLEDRWDYGYVMVSSDDGATWHILPTPHTTTDNPHNTGYGAGYTGASGRWLQESVSLADYAGQEIWVRFAVITDDAVTQPGMAIDDVRIEAVGYASDFEADDGGWQAEGWVWMDNVIPLRSVVQMAQLLPDGGVTVERCWLADGGGTCTFPRDPSAERVFVMVSPLAQVTTVGQPYTLVIDDVGS